MRKVMIWALCALIVMALSGVAVAEEFRIEKIAGRDNPDLMNFIWVSEGYTQEQLPRYVARVKTETDTMLKMEPLKTLKNCLRVFVMSVASQDSGVSFDPGTSVGGPTGLKVNTYFGATSNGQGVLIQYPAVNALKNTLKSILPVFDPAKDAIGFLVNHPRAGGSAYMGESIGFGRDSPYLGADAWIMAHEVWGHGVIGAADESRIIFDTPPTNLDGYTESWYPNITRVSDLSRLKWRLWLTPGIPIPTPNDWRTYQGTGKVGLFPGAMYEGANSGWFRPSYECMMGQGGHAFCSICAEALYLVITKRVGMIDDYYPSVPSGTVITVSDTMSFGIVPNRGTLVGQWYLDRKLVNGGGLSLRIDPKNVTPGTHDLELAFIDTTKFVRNDPKGILSARVSWKIDIQDGDGTDPKSTAADFDNSGMVDLNDFFMFAEAFGLKRGNPQYDVLYDLDKDGEVGFTDFFIFADAFGKKTKKPATK